MVSQSLLEPMTTPTWMGVIVCVGGQPWAILPAPRQDGTRHFTFAAKLPDKHGFLAT
jgi:hypothetical protein